MQNNNNYKMGFNSHNRYIRSSIFVPNSKPVFKYAQKPVPNPAQKYVPNPAQKPVQKPAPKSILRKNNNTIQPKKVSFPDSNKSPKKRKGCGCGS